MKLHDHDLNDYCECCYRALEDGDCVFHSFEDRAVAAERMLDVESDEPYAKPGLAPSWGELATISLIVLAMFVFGLAMNIAEGR